MKKSTHKIGAKSQLRKRQIIRFLKSPIVFVGVFAVAGIVLLVVTRASTSTASLEAEQGVRTTNAAQVSDSSASNQKAIKFTSGGSTATWWKPAQLTRWNWVLEGGVNTTNTTELARYDMYDIDMQSMVPAATQQTITWPASASVPGGYSTTITWPKGDNAGLIADLHNKGKKVICYIDTGAFEDYRPDASAFPGKWGAGNNRSTSDNSSAQAMFGPNVPYVGPPQLANLDPIGGGSSDANGQSFDGEYWLDQNAASTTGWQNVWGPIIWARMDLAKKIGCDGVEGDQNNAYDNDSTFGVTQAVSLRLFREVYYQLHTRGLTAISKNGVELTSQQATNPTDIAYCTPGLCIADGFLNEECGIYQECSSFDTVTSRGFWVGQAEYADDRDGAIPATKANICPAANSAGRMAIIKPKVQNVTETNSVLCWE